MRGEPRGQEDTVAVATRQVDTTRRYRPKMDFDEIDRADFRDESFGIIRNHFEQSVKEIDTVEGIRARFRSLGPTSFSCTVINQMKDRAVAHITVHCSSDRGFGDITYSFAENAPSNTMRMGADACFQPAKTPLSLNAMMCSWPLVRTMPSTGSNGILVWTLMNGACPLSTAKLSLRRGLAYFLVAMPPGGRKTSSGQLPTVTRPQFQSTCIVVTKH